MKEIFRLFLVEDDPDDQFLLKMAFEEMNIPIAITCFENGKALYEHLTLITENSEWPHLILLDLNLPLWDGKKTLSVLKKHANLKTIPVVIYTTSRSDQDMREAYQLGANSYIVKPSKYENLLESVDALCRYWFKVVRYSGIT